MAAIEIIHGDCLAILPTLPADSFHAIVTDPPYGLEFMGRAWDSFSDAPRAVPGTGGRQAPFAVHSTANWQTGAGFSKPGIGERETPWPSFTGSNDEFGGANPTCATCGGRARGKRKCACAEPDWRVKGAAPDRNYGRQRQMQNFQAFNEAWAREGLRVLKPGAHMLAFGGTRTYHRLACAIEDAGFEIRDAIMWHYGSGFPKSHDVERSIAKCTCQMPGRHFGRGLPPPDERQPEDHICHVTPESEPWGAFGTALKPATEIICVARKPLVGTVAANVLAHGCGALNVDGCRVPIDADADASQLRTMQRGQRIDDTNGQTWGLSKLAADEPQVVRPDGRWPANLIHDGSDEVLALFPESDGCQPHAVNSRNEQYDGWGTITNKHGETIGYEGAGSAARFFYTAKADKQDRLGSKHPTVKPVDLMRYLVRLVTPPGGRVLDPFAGSGTTGMAALAEGFDCTLIEREAEAVADCRRRVAHVRGDDTPLFAGPE